MQNEQKLETGHFGPLRYNEGHPRRGVALRRNEGCLAVARPKGQKVRPPPPLDFTTTQRSSATLWCRHCSHEPFLDFCFRTLRICTPIV